MRYDVKVIINGVEVTDQASDSSPSITGVSYQNSVSEGPLQIGTVAVDKLTFTLLNPYKASFDGDKVELWVNPDEDEEGIDRMSELEELIGDETDDEGIDEDDTDVYEDETEEDGEDLTDEELEESEAEEAELDAKVIGQVEGESTDNEEAEETDEAEEETWRLIGTFFVYKQKQTDTGIQLTCYDSMMFLHGSYTPDTATDTVQNHYNAFRTACQEETGVPIDEMEFDDVYNKTITWDFTCSYRDALGYFAGLVGGYAHADADGEIGISFYLASDITLLSEELLSYNEESAGELVLDGMSCNRSRATNLTTDLIETGAGQAVSLTNPFVDEGMLEDIFDMYRGVRYIGASLSCKWDESLQAGELIRIMSEAEYENWLRMNNAADAAEDEETEKEIRLQMAQLGKMVLIGTQTIVFAGEAVSTIRSTSRAETAKENEMISPWKKSAMELADAAASALTDAVIEYALGDSADTAPESGWSSVTPEWTSGKYVWQKTTVKDGKGNETVTTTCIQGAKGEDAILLQIDSSSGTTFKTDGVSTVLTVTIRYGDQIITAEEAMLETFGANAALVWSEKKKGAIDFVDMASDDSKISNSGFSLTLTPSDVDDKSVFTCTLMEKDPIVFSYSLTGRTAITMADLITGTVTTYSDANYISDYNINTGGNGYVSSTVQITDDSVTVDCQTYYGGLLFPIKVTKGKSYTITLHMTIGIFSIVDASTMASAQPRFAEVQKYTKWSATDIDYTFTAPSNLIGLGFGRSDTRPAVFSNIKLVEN